MWRMLEVMQRNLQNMRKSPRVADESMFRDGNEAEMDRGRSGWNGLSVICSIVRAPLSCFADPHISGADAIWSSGELARISEMNHLMVSDSMRYAILM